MTRAAIEPAALTQAIRDLTAEWIASGKVASARAIGDGHCYDFAQAVMERLGAPGYGDGYDPAVQGLQDIRSEDFEADDFFADLDLLRARGEPVPDDLPQGELAALIGCATHGWLALGGRHYDATAPEGRDHFLEMPFFADQIAGLRGEILNGL